MTRSARNDRVFNDKSVPFRALYVLSVHRLGGNLWIPAKNMPE